VADDLCQYCGRITFGDICVAHGFVGPTPVKSGGGGVVPAGGIIMWSGALSALPVGWQLCDGTGTTPDLRERFVIGAGATAPGNYGGTNAGHTHGFSGGVSGSADGVTCNPAGVNEHTLSGLTGLGGNHNHATSGTSGTPSATNNLTTGSGNVYATGGHTHSIAGTTDYPGSHQHDPSGISVSSHGTHSHTLNSGTISGTAAGTTAGASNFPVAYYYLAFIMRL